MINFAKHIESYFISQISVFPIYLSHFIIGVNPAPSHPEIHYPLWFSKPVNFQFQLLIPPPCDTGISTKCGIFILDIIGRVSILTPFLSRLRDHQADIYLQIQGSLVVIQITFLFINIQGFSQFLSIELVFIIFSPLC